MSHKYKEQIGGCQRDIGCGEERNRWGKFVVVVVTQSCPTLGDPMDCSTTGFPVYHHLPELAQTRVHWVGDAIQPFCPLLSPSPPALIFLSIRVFSLEVIKYLPFVLMVFTTYKFVFYRSIILLAINYFACICLVPLLSGVFLITSFFQSQISLC